MNKLSPTPCPYSQAWILEIPLRSLFAGPKKIIHRFHITPGSQFLEIGSGTGYYSVSIMKRLNPQGTLICLDLQYHMLLKVRDKLESIQPKNIAFVCGSAMDLPLDSGSVDQVFLITVLGEIPDRMCALAAIRRVLKPHGILSVSEQLFDTDFIFLSPLRKMLSDAGFEEMKSKDRLFYASNWKKG